MLQYSCEVRPKSFSLRDEREKIKKGGHGKCEVIKSYYRSYVTNCSIIAALGY